MEINQAQAILGIPTAPLESPLTYALSLHKNTAKEREVSWPGGSNLASSAPREIILL